MKDGQNGVEKETKDARCAEEESATYPVCMAALMLCYQFLEGN